MKDPEEYTRILTIALGLPQKKRDIAADSLSDTIDTLHSVWCANPKLYAALKVLIDTAGEGIYYHNAAKA